MWFQFLGSGTFSKRRVVFINHRPKLPLNNGHEWEGKALRLEVFSAAAEIVAYAWKGPCCEYYDLLN